MNLPLVSVVVPCYNHEKYVQECIQSIIDQDYQNIELIIIDDGSQDGSVEKIQEMVSSCEQRFLRFEFRSRPNKGLCATLNEAIDWCEGEYYSAIASDDVMLNNKCSIQVAYLKSTSNCSAVFGGSVIINENGKELYTRKVKKTEITFKQLFLSEKSVSAPTQMIRLTDLKEITPLPQNLYIEDWYTWLRLTDKGYAIHVIEDVLVKYRRHTGNISGYVEEMHSSRSDIIRLFSDNKLYKKSIVSSYVTSAIEVATVSKMKSCRYIRAALRLSPGYIFNRRFLIFLYKLFRLPL